jgi:hypothetical protein
MLDATKSGCINHHGVEAVARCKQCGKPVCGACLVVGSTGHFCGADCKEKHEKFIARAQEISQTKKRTGTLVKIRRALIKTTMFLVAVAALGFAAAYFEIPVAGQAATKVYEFIAGYLPFLQ